LRSFGGFVTNILGLQVSNSNGNQIRLNWNLTRETVSSGIVWIVHRGTSIIGTHFNNIAGLDCNIRCPGELVGWSILKRSDGSACDILTLRIKI